MAAQGNTTALRAGGVDNTVAVWGERRHFSAHTQSLSTSLARPGHCCLRAGNAGREKSLSTRYCTVLYDTLLTACLHGAQWTGLSGIARETSAHAAIDRVRMWGTVPFVPHMAM